MLEALCCIHYDQVELSCFLTDGASGSSYGLFSLHEIFGCPVV